MATGRNILFTTRRISEPLDRDVQLPQERKEAAAAFLSRRTLHSGAYDDDVLSALVHLQVEKLGVAAPADLEGRLHEPEEEAFFAPSELPTDAIVTYATIFELHDRGGIARKRHEERYCLTEKGLAFVQNYF